MPAENGGTNCTEDDSELEAFIMLSGGRQAFGQNAILEPQFFSLNPSNPLPASLSGTKTSIDGQTRRTPAMIETPGEEVLTRTGENLLF